MKHAAFLFNTLGSLLNFYILKKRKENYLWLFEQLRASVEAFEQNSTSEGDEQPFIWSVLNNLSSIQQDKYIFHVVTSKFLLYLISHFTCTNLFAAFPNIVWSFSEYLGNHSLSFMSSLWGRRKKIQCTHTYLFWNTVIVHNMTQTLHLLSLQCYSQIYSGKCKKKSLVLFL